MLSFTLPPRSTYTAEPLLGGFDGTEQTIRKIRQIFDDAMRSLDVRRFAVDILRNSGAPQYDAWSQISAIYQFVRNHFYFVNDPVGKEVLMPFEDLLALGAGDCDEINAIAMAVLLSAVGYETRLVTIAADANDPEQFSHIYTEVGINGNWVAMDAARPGAQMGAAPPSFYVREWWSLTDDEHGPYPGKGQMGQYHSMRTRPHFAGLNGYALAGYLGQDGTDLTDLPLAPASTVLDSVSPMIDPSITDFIPQGPDLPIGADASGNPIYAGGSSPGGAASPSLFNAILTGGSNILNQVKSFVAPSALKPAIGPGGASSLSPTGGTAAIGGVSMNTLLIGGLLLFGGILLVKAMGSK